MFIKINDFNEVCFTHYVPELLSADILNSGIITNSTIPDVVHKKGFNCIICYDKVDDKFYSIYKERPLNQDELAEEQRQKIAQLESDNANITYALMMGGLI